MNRHTSLLHPREQHWWTHCPAPCLQGKLPSWVGLPASVALPFGTFEQVLGDSGNAEVRAELERLAGEAAQGNLAALRQAVLRLREPAQLREQVLATSQQEGE